MTGPILVIEDDKKTASLVALYLKREGFQVMTAYDGRQALELARRNKPNVVCSSKVAKTINKIK